MWEFDGIRPCQNDHQQYSIKVLGGIRGYENESRHRHNDFHQYSKTNYFAGVRGMRTHCIKTQQDFAIVCSRNKFARAEA